MNTQNTETPWEFIKWVESWFGIKFNWDLMASAENAKARFFITEEDDTFTRAWNFLDGPLWCNPQFKQIGRVAKKCEEESIKGADIYTIWPLSCAKNVETAYIHADVTILQGRVWPLVRDCMLCHWHPDVQRLGPRPISVVNWRESRRIV